MTKWNVLNHIWHLVTEQMFGRLQSTTLEKLGNKEDHIGTYMVPQRRETDKISRANWELWGGVKRRGKEEGPLF